MTPKSFWTIFIKMLGIYLMLHVFTAISSFLNHIAYASKSNDLPKVIEIFIVIVFVMIAYILIFRIFIFRPEWIIKKLKLEEGFDEEKFEFNIHRSTILRISTIVVGGLLFAYSLPDLCMEIFTYFKQDPYSSRSVSTRDATWIIFYFIKMFVGYFLMANSRMIVNYIERNRKE